MVMGLFGLAGVVYTGVVTRRASRTVQYKPVMEDWLFHAVLPFVAYLMILGGALTLTRFDIPALFTIASASLLLLVVGVHNAWDTVTFLALDMPGYEKAPRESATPPTNQ
jgi:hypothetical protein